MIQPWKDQGVQEIWLWSLKFHKGFKKKKKKVTIPARKIHPSDDQDLSNVYKIKSPVS